MSTKTKKVLAWVIPKLLIPLLLGLLGYAVNSFPLEIFPGVHLLLGSTIAVLVSVRYGPVAGATAGLTAGLHWSLWHQAFPLGAILYGFEAWWTGYHTKRRRHGPLIAVLTYWALIGSWLTLVAHILISDLTIRGALIAQAQSLINGLLTGIAVELIILTSELASRWRFWTAKGPARLSLHSLVALVFLTVTAMPILYISTRNVQSMRERTMNDFAASRTRDADAIKSEVGTLLESYQRGVAMAATLCSSPAHRTESAEELSRLLASVRDLYPEFAGMYVADSKGRTVGFDPQTTEGEKQLIKGDITNQEYYHKLAKAKSTVYSLVGKTPAGVSGPAVTIAEPLLDSGGNFQGFVLGWFDLQSFYGIVSRFSSEDQDHTIADSGGFVIADASTAPDLRHQLKSVLGRSDFELVKDKADSAVEFSKPHLEEADSDFAVLDDAFLVAHTILPSTGWKIWSKQSLAPLKSRLKEIYLSQLTVLILALFVALILSNVVARFLIRPTLELQRSAAALAAGNLSERPPRRRLVTVEYDSLFHSFDVMAQRLESTWNRQQELLQEVSITKGELEAIFDAMTDAVVITDPEDRVVRSNRAFCRLRDIDLEQTIGRQLVDIAHADEDWSACEVCLARREGRHVVVLRRPNETKVRRHLEIRVDPIFNDAGERLGAVQVVRDLTERRQVEVEAERASSLLKNLLDAAYDGVFATDLTGRFLWANTRAADLFGFAGLTIEGESFLQFIHPDDLGRVRSNFSLASNGEAQRYELRCVTPNGNERHALITNSPIYAENEIVGVLGVMRDVTEERMAAEQTLRSDKLRALGQLASGVAHNFNNALTAVLGYTQMALTEVADPKVSRYLNTVEKAALDAARMVQRVQNFARQRQDDSLAPANVSHIVRDALDLTRSRWRDDARAAGIEYDILFRPADGLMVTCDESALREVFVNIIINALDAMPDGGRLTITATLENNNVLVSFDDSGCGMTEEVRQRIFEPFYTTKGVKGYGMGLAVSFGIIGRHGGEIQVRSEQGRGATFTLRLPVARRVVEESLSEQAPNARTASVLVVDDELPIRTMLADLMRARGHKVLTAEDGLAGLRAIEASRFDLVITDLSMPGADGWTLVNEVRRRWPGTKLVMVTGYGGFADLAIGGGDSSLIDALISKPFNIAQIDTTINELLL